MRSSGEGATRWREVFGLTPATLLASMLMTLMSCSQPAAERVPDPVPADVQALLPMFMDWALEGEPLPGQPSGEYAFPDTSFLNLGPPPVIYVNIDRSTHEEQHNLQGADRFDWLYLPDEGKIAPIIAEQRHELVEQWEAGTLGVRQQARFMIEDAGPGQRIRVQFSIGHAGCEAVMRQTDTGWTLAGKPHLWIH